MATDVDRGADLVKISRDFYGEIQTTVRHFEVSKEHADDKPHDVVVDSDYFYLTVHSDKDGKEFDKVLKVSRKTLKVVSFQKIFKRCSCGVTSKIRKHYCC